MITGRTARLVGVTDSRMRAPIVEPSSVFVYGTLKRGQAREKRWPRRPISVEPAKVRGALYDLGPYPGLVAGDDLVVGEVWSFTADDMPATLAVLDEIEGFTGGDNDEYRRAVITCFTAAGPIDAWTYFYARTSQLRAEQRIRPNAYGSCHWPQQPNTTDHGPRTTDY